MNYLEEEVFVDSEGTSKLLLSRTGVYSRECKAKVHLLSTYYMHTYRGE